MLQNLVGVLRMARRQGAHLLHPAASRQEPAAPTQQLCDDTNVAKPDRQCMNGVMLALFKRPLLPLTCRV